jgi:hypothetical protein
MLKHIFVVWFVLSCCCVASAKCGNSAILIKGEISGYVGGTTVSVQVAPDPNWEPQPAPTIDAEERFQVTVYFDRTKSEGRVRDNCSRKPESVTVQLRKNGRVLDKTTLGVKKDFVRKNGADYEIRYPITLHAN